jgi:predicted RNA-binding protein with TRAM domain
MSTSDLLVMEVLRSDMICNEIGYRTTKRVYWSGILECVYRIWNREMRRMRKGGRERREEEVEMGVEEGVEILRMAKVGDMIAVEEGRIVVAGTVMEGANVGMGLEELLSVWWERRGH